ncbi:hypothetical protein ARMGADRAFT_733000 [Armillaria gallica]|uniref:Uncharacterized protein n=1 Tax=Armillaria gallica TaxID=47427 RepID=A0A2H3D4M1_ARMGA|nr:hypothetical protein ARMGADRAFT_733000 [Armillaria gallica]
MFLDSQAQLLQESAAKPGYPGMVADTGKWLCDKRKINATAPWTTTTTIMEEAATSIPAISSLAIHDFTKGPEPATMTRAPSFPSLLYTNGRTVPAPLPVPTTGHHLDMKLLDKIVEDSIGAF